MKNIENKVSQTVVVADTSPSSVETAWTHQAYHEMADVPVVQKDAISQLHSNIAQLQDLQSRLSFVMKEVRYLMKG